MADVKRNLIDRYESLTSVEQSIADFFVNNESVMDFSASNIARILYISNATLSRFAKKCGYKGYREFVFDYEKQLREQIAENSISALTKRVKQTYVSLLEESFRLMDEEQIRRVASMLGKYRRVLVCGVGSSGYAASEMAFRMMRLGLNIQAVTDTQTIQMMAAVTSADSLLVAISLSGKTPSVLHAMRLAKAREAGVVFITSNQELRDLPFCDEVLIVAASHNLDQGTAISPQFPILILVDAFYAWYFHHDAQNVNKQYQITLSALKQESRNRK